MAAPRRVSGPVVALTLMLLMWQSGVPFGISWVLLRFPGDKLDNPSKFCNFSPYRLFNSITFNLTNMTQNPHEFDSLDARLDGWREPVIREGFTQSVVRAAQCVPHLVESETTQENVVTGFFADPIRQGVAAAACLAFLLTAISSTLRPEVSVPSDFVEQAVDSDDAVTELNRLIYWEELANQDSLEAMDNADMALLLFATGG